MPIHPRKLLRKYRNDRKAREKQKLLKQAAENVLKERDAAIISLGRSEWGKRPFSLLIGPANSAGQANQWSRAISKRGKPAQSLRISNDPASEWFPCDIAIARLEWTSLEGRISLAEQIVSNFDAVLIESMRPLFSLHTLRDYSARQTFEDIDLLKRSKVKTAIVFHGSDIRDTEAHARREKFSPYRQSSPELEVLRKRATEFRTAGREAYKKGIPVFVTTPDLLLDMPHAQWLPITIDVEHFVAAGRKRPCWSESGPVKVLFQPSRGWLKSASLVDPILKRLVDEKVIELIGGDPIAQDRMAERIASADVLIDRFDGIAGVASMEALATGRIVIANMAKWAHKHAEATPPVLHSTPDTLEETLRQIARERESFRWDAVKALAHVRRWHDGRESATRIEKFLRK